MKLKHEHDKIELLASISALTFFGILAIVITLVN